MIYQKPHSFTPYQSLINSRTRLQSFSSTQPLGQRLLSVRTGNERLQTYKHTLPGAYSTPPTIRPFTFLESTLRSPQAKAQTCTYARYGLGSKSPLTHSSRQKTFMPTHFASQKIPLTNTLKSKMQIFSSVQASKGILPRELTPLATYPSLAKASSGKVFSRYELAAFATLPSATGVKALLSPTSTPPLPDKRMLSLYDLVAPIAPTNTASAQPTMPKSTPKSTPKSLTVLPATAEQFSFVAAAEAIDKLEIDSSSQAKLDSCAIAKESAKNTDSAANSPINAFEYKIKLKSARVGTMLPSNKDTKIKFNEEVRLKIVRLSEHSPAIYDLNKKPMQGKKSAKGILVTQRKAHEIQREKNIESKLQANIQIKFNREEREFRRDRLGLT